MAFKVLRYLAIVSLAFFATVQGTLGEIDCEYLNEDTCAFAVSYEGKRCVLEKRVKRSGEEAYTCKTSEIEAEKQKNHIESDECIKACGLNRKSFGISSDSLLETRFTQNLCSPQCYQNCPNIVDLYFNLAAGEGVFLPKLCEENVRRQTSELKSSGIVALGSVHSLQSNAVSPQSFHATEFEVEPALTPGLPAEPALTPGLPVEPALTPGLPVEHAFTLGLAEPAQTPGLAAEPSLTPGLAADEHALTPGVTTKPSLTLGPSVESALTPELP